MPIHDWTNVTLGTFHDFHSAWIVALRSRLNSGLLPGGYYALAEQVAGNTVPDVLTLQDTLGSDDADTWEDTGGGTATAKAPPKTSIHDSVMENRSLASKRRRIVIRHTTGDRIVALLEIVSPGNKDSRTAVDQFVDKAVAALESHFHLLVIDLFPPGPYDPDGIHGKLWGTLGGNYEPPAGKPLTLSAYAVSKDGPLDCYVEPTAVRLPLIDMPLFYTSTRYVDVPLEQTYLEAYSGVPNRWKRVIEGGGG